MAARFCELQSHRHDAIDANAPRLVSLVGGSCGPVMPEITLPVCTAITQLTPGNRICAGQSITIEGTSPDCPSWRCAWERDSVPLPTTLCTLVDAPSATSTYTLHLQCDVLPCMDSVDVTVEVAAAAATPVGNELRLARSGATRADITFAWQDTGDLSYNLRYSDGRRFDHPTASLLATVATNRHVAIDEVSLAPPARTYVALAVGCDAMEEP